MSGHGGSQLAIRRAVWAPGIERRDDAIQYVNRIVAREIDGPGGERPRVLDLGCGVGGSLIYLAERTDAELMGVTISRVQAELGRRFVRERRLDSIRIEEGDLTDPEYWNAHPPASLDVVFAIESFIHVHDVLAHLPEIASRIRPGGRLVIVDDMISRAASRRDPSRRERRWLREFSAGWFAHGLVSVEQMIAAAAAAGLPLLEARHLTGYLELDRPRDTVARAFISMLRWWPLRTSWFNNLLGGNALQLALKSGLLGYYSLVFRAPTRRA
ncbi:MAG: SAM-dependent methyltransferase [Spirochaetota bacterium]